MLYRKEMKVRHDERVVVRNKIGSQWSEANMTVGDALKKDSQGRDEWCTSNGTVDVEISLSDVREFESRHNVKTVWPTVYKKNGYAYVWVRPDDWVE